MMKRVSPKMIKKIFRLLSGLLSRPPPRTPTVAESPLSVTQTTISSQMMMTTLNVNMHSHPHNLRQELDHPGRQTPPHLLPRPPSALLPPPPSLNITTHRHPRSPLLSPKRVISWTSASP